MLRNPSLSGGQEEKISCACVWHHNSSRTREAQALEWDVQCLMDNHPLDTQKLKANFGQPGYLSVVPACLLGVSELHNAFNKCVHTYNLRVATPSKEGTHIDNTCDTRCLWYFIHATSPGRRCGYKCSQCQCVNSTDLSISIIHHSEAVTRHSKSESESQI